MKRGKKSGVTKKSSVSKKGWGTMELEMASNQLLIRPKSPPQPRRNNQPPPSTLPPPASRPTAVSGLPTPSSSAKVNFHGHFFAWDDASHKSGHVVEGVLPTNEYIFDELRWGLERKSQRIRDRKEREKVSIASPGPGPARTKAAHKAFRAEPYPTPTRSSHGTPSSSATTSSKPKADISPFDTLMNLPKEALERLKPQNKRDALHCLWCGRKAGNKACGVQCYRDFHRDHLRSVIEDQLEIRRSGDMGCGVFVQNGVTIEKGEHLGLYVGEILPCNAPELRTGRYLFELLECDDKPDTEVVINAESHGNWTRFVNSHCKPNVAASIQQVGNMLFITYTSRRKLESNEELFVSYGPGYFTSSQSFCFCDAEILPHIPPELDDNVAGLN